MVETRELDWNVAGCFASGNTAAFAIIYKFYYKSIKLNISKLIPDKDVAEDILQDVFLKLFDNKPPVKNANELSAWLFRVSYNASITYIRAMLRSRKFIQSELHTTPSVYTPANEELFNTKEVKEGLLREAIELLPTRKRQVFDLCKFQGKSYAEAGSLLGIERDTVKEYLAASMKFIKRYMVSKNVLLAIIIYFLLSLR